MIEYWEQDIEIDRMHSKFIFSQSYSFSFAVYIYLFSSICFITRAGLFMHHPGQDTEWSITSWSSVCPRFCLRQCYRDLQFILTVSNQKQGSCPSCLLSCPAGRASCSLLSRAEVIEEHEFPPTQEVRKVRIVGTTHLDSRITHTSERVGNYLTKRRNMNSGRGIRLRVSTACFSSHQVLKPSL